MKYIHQISGQIPAIVVSMILLACTVMHVKPIWSEADSILVQTIAGITGFSFLMIITGRAEKHFRWTKIDSVVFAWYLYIMLYAYLETTYPVSTTVLKSTLFLSLYFSLRILYSSSQIHGDVLAAGIIVTALLEAIIGLYQFYSGSSLHHRYPMTGTFFNPGPYATMLGLGIVLTVSLQKKYRASIESCQYGKHIKKGILSALVLFAAILMFTWSRAAVLATALVLLLMFRHEIRKYTWKIVPIAILCIFLFYYMKRGSANGRGIIAWISIHIIKDNSVFGTGIGSFFHQYAEKMQELSALLPDGQPVSADVLTYAFNDLLLIGVEQGSVGVLFACMLLAALFHKMRKQTSVMKWGLPVLLFTSLFSYTFELLPFQIITVMLMAYASGCNTKVSSTKMSVLTRRHLTPLLCMIAFSVIGCLFSVTRIKDRVAANEAYTQLCGFMDTAFIDDYYELLPLMSENPRFLFTFGKILREAGRHNDSNAILRHGTLVSNDPMFCVLTGNNYKDMGEMKKAEEYYMKAFRMMPNRLYPLYKLMLLYEENGDRLKAIKTAERIVRFPVKVMSPATEEMKQTAKQLMLKEHT